jgi:hypothetical protein
MTRVIALGAAALGLVSFVLPASAQEYAPPIPFRLLSDPAYLPLAGQLFGSTAYTISDGSADDFDAAGDKTAKRKSWQQTIKQEVEYGVTNDLAVRVTESYIPLDKTKDEFTAGGATDHDRAGLTDPSIGLTWRVVDQANSSPVNLDLLADYQANLIDARTNNVAQGGESGEFGAAISKVMPNFTIYGKAAADRYGASSQFDPATPNFVRTGSYWDYLVDLQTQTRLNDLFSINAGVGYVFANNARVTDVTTGTDHIAAPGDGLKLNAALNYQVVPNSLVASLTYDFRHDYTSKDLFALPAADTFLRNHDDNQFGVKLDYVMP